jgi:hypothetical protein
MSLASGLERFARWVDRSWIGYPVRTPDPEAIAFPSGITAEGLAVRLAQVSRPAAAVLAAGVEAKSAQSATDRTLKPAAPMPKRTPRPPRRTLHPHEFPTLTAERIIELGEGVEPGLDDRHPVDVHASRLHFWLRTPGMGLDDPPISRGTVERGLFAWQAEQVYYDMCFHLWWRPHRWSDAGGVAEHFRRLLTQDQKERRRRPGERKAGTKCWKWGHRPDLDGKEHYQHFYPIPAPALKLGQATRKPTPQRTPKPAEADSGKPRKPRSVMGSQPLRRAA